MTNEKKNYYSENPYTVATSQNGKKYVDFHTVKRDELNLSLENSKVGQVLGFNLPIHYSCDHRCECYKDGKCYACAGCYNFMSNQALYSENLAFYFYHTETEFIDAICDAIASNPKYKLFRWFECGDILSYTFFKSMVEVARRNPDVTFWTYTKKYDIVNRYADDNGVDAIPQNLTVIFSHWMNKDGSYFPMENPHSFPTSEFIPMGREELTETVTHICPCSDPSVIAQCATCDHPCFKLAHGQSMALLEHSTPETRKRDKEVKAAHMALENARKASKGRMTA